MGLRRMHYGYTNKVAYLKELRPQPLGQLCVLQLRFMQIHEIYEAAHGGAFGVGGRNDSGIQNLVRDHTQVIVGYTRLCLGS